jgi:hypothetical protein
MPSWWGGKGEDFCGRNFFVDRVWGSDSTWVDNSHDLGVAQACVERCGSTHPDPPTRIHPPGSVGRGCSAIGRARPGYHAGSRRSSGLPQGRTLRGCGEWSWGHSVFATGVDVFSEPEALSASSRGAAAGGCGLEVFSHACAVAGDREPLQVHQGPPVVRWVSSFPFPSGLSGPGWAPECGGLCGRAEDLWG